MQNQLREHRKKKGLTQRKLAELIGTSQQQIQRIESGILAARLDLAIKICAALETPLDALFPGTTKLLKKAKAERQATRSLPEDAWEEMSESSGVEGDPRSWFLKVLLRGHRKEIIVPISAADERRLFSCLQGESELDPFVVFDSDGDRIAMSVRDVVSCQFLYEIGLLEKSREKESYHAEVFYSNNPTLWRYPVDTDRGSPEDEDDPGCFRSIFFYLETSIEPGDRLIFEDGDGEYVFMRAGDLAMLRVPLHIMFPSQYEGDEDEETED